MQVNKEDLIFRALTESHMVFPDYKRTTRDIEMMLPLFVRHLQKFAIDDLSVAFDDHMRTGREFPKIYEIVEKLTPVRAYRMDYGPNGIGAIYHPDHLYVRLQTRLGQDLSRYETTIRGLDAERYALEAANAPPIEFGEDDEPRIAPRNGSGLRQISFEDFTE